VHDLFGKPVPTFPDHTQARLARLRNPEKTIAVAGSPPVRHAVCK
jgi:hypothetical protein